MSAALPHALAELCRRVGVELGYWDVRGSLHQAGPEALCAILGALGHEVPAPELADAALAAQDRAVWSALAPPVAVGFGAGRAVLGLRVPASADGAIELVIVREDGVQTISTARLFELPVTFVAEVDGQHLAERRLELPELPPGYHRATVTVLGRQAETLIIQAPERCHAPPGAMCDVGLFAPTYALGGERGAPCGDLADLAALCQQTAALGGRHVGTLPLLAASYATPLEPSPYSPISRLFWNELYLDAAALAAELGAPAAAARPAGPAPLDRDAAPASLDYARAYQLQRQRLDDLAGRAWTQPAVRAELEAAIAARPRLDDYARFRAALAHQRAPWSAWPAAARAGDLAGLEDEAERRFHVFVQWAMDRQLGSLKRAAERGDAAGLYLDLPVGSSPAGYDLWRERAVFAPGIAVGAPPDPLAWAGQNWGLPPLSPPVLRRSGYRFLIDCVRHHVAAATTLRIDHVMGLHRLFWIPDGMPASAGVYVRYPADELWAVVTLESARGRTAIVGEDLGTVPDDVRPTMAARGVHRLAVAQFDWAGQGGAARPRPVPAGSVASLDTHDTRTFAAFAEGEGFGDPATLLGPWLEALGDSDADLVLVTLEDLWLEREPQNVPGTTDDERPNWRQRLRHAPAEALASPRVRGLFAALLAARKSAAARRGALAG